MSAKEAGIFTKRTHSEDRGCDQLQSWHIKTKTSSCVLTFHSKSQRCSRLNVVATTAGFTLYESQGSLSAKLTEPTESGDEAINIMHRCLTPTRSPARDCSG